MTVHLLLGYITMVTSAELITGSETGYVSVLRALKHVKLEIYILILIRTCENNIQLMKGSLKILSLLP